MIQEPTEVPWRSGMMELGLRLRQSGVNPMFQRTRARYDASDGMGRRSEVPGRYDYAELIAALWKLGAPKERMPTSHGVLDKALMEILSRPEFPDAYRGGLSFGQTTVGLRCFELPDILLAAQEALITSEPNPTYLTTEVRLDNESAREIVVGAGMTTRDARSLGSALKTVVDELCHRWALQGMVSA